MLLCMVVTFWKLHIESFKIIDKKIKHMKYYSQLGGLAFNNQKTKIENFWKLFKRFVEIKEKNKIRPPNQIFHARIEV